jgi:F-type H+-transporting ATPase subunit b
MAVAIRYFLFPKLKKGMDDRYAGIRADHESAEATTAAARGDVAEYEKALVAVRAEAAAKVDAARQTLDSERQAAINELNSRIAARRSEADAALSAAREANRSQITAAVSAVVTRATELSVGRAPDAAVVERAIADAMAGGSR